VSGFTFGDNFKPQQSAVRGDHLKIRWLGYDYASQLSDCRSIVHKPSGPAAIRFLAGGAKKYDVALQLRAGLDDPADGSNDCGDAALHIRGSAPVDFAVAFHRGKRRICPLCFARPDNIEMAHK
jgi:hypothetical protein